MYKEITDESFLKTSAFVAGVDLSLLIITSFVKDLVLHGL